MSSANYPADSWSSAVHGNTDDADCVYMTATRFADPESMMGNTWKPTPGPTPTPTPGPSTAPTPAPSPGRSPGPTPGPSPGPTPEPQKQTPNPTTPAPSSEPRRRLSTRESSDGPVESDPRESPLPGDQAGGREGRRLLSEPTRQPTEYHGYGIGTYPEYAEWQYGIWKFEECAEADKRKGYVCEKEVACPREEAHAYPCYHQPDNDLDWCSPLVISDTTCETLWSGDQLVEPGPPSMSLGYMHYLHTKFNDANPATVQMLALNAACDPNGAKAYPVTMFSSRILLLASAATPFTLSSGWSDGQTPIGFLTPLSQKVAATNNDDDNADYASRHGICVNIRAEAQDALPDRTMIETTHCCGTSVYYAESILKMSGLASEPANTWRDRFGPWHQVTASGATYTSGVP